MADAVPQKITMLGIETGIIVVIVLLFFSDPLVVAEPVRIFFNVILTFVIAAIIAPYFFERYERERDRLLGVFSGFAVQAVILYVAGILYFGLPAEVYLDSLVLLAAILSAPIVTVIWLGVYTTLESLHRPRSESEDKVSPIREPSLDTPDQ